MIKKFANENKNLNFRRLSARQKQTVQSPAASSRSAPANWTWSSTTASAIAGRWTSFSGNPPPPRRTRSFEPSSLPSALPTSGASSRRRRSRKRLARWSSGPRRGSYSTFPRFTTSASSSPSTRGTLKESSLLER